MFKINSFKKVTHPKWGLFACIYDCSYKGMLTSENERDNLNHLFSEIKLSHFRFEDVLSHDSMNLAAHGNFQLLKISLDDYTKFPFYDTKQVVDDFIEQNIHEKVSNAEKYHFINEVAQLLEFFLKKPKYCYFLNSESNIPQDKRAHFQDFDWFKSFLFFHNHGDKNSFVYLKIGAD